MDRRDKTNYYLDMAQVALERGTCLRRNFAFPAYPSYLPEALLPQ